MRGTNLPSHLSKTISLRHSSSIGNLGTKENPAAADSDGFVPVSLSQSSGGRPRKRMVLGALLVFSSLSLAVIVPIH